MKEATLLLRHRFGAIPYRRPKRTYVPAVYFLINRGRVKYVGQTIDIHARLIHHERMARGDRVVFIPLRRMRQKTRIKIEIFFQRLFRTSRNRRRKIYDYGFYAIKPPGSIKWAEAFIKKYRIPLVK